LQPDNHDNAPETPRFGILGDPRHLKRRAAEERFERALDAAGDRLWIPEEFTLQ
jgi:hypothetical protein